MNNNINVSSPNFGMAYLKGNTKRLAKHLNELKPEQLNELTEKMADAAGKLKGTMFADAMVHAAEDGKTLYHEVTWYAPYFKEDGSVATGGLRTTVNTIEEAVKTTLEKEKEMEAAWQYARAQEALLKRLL